MSAAVGVVFLVLLAPVVTTWGSRPTSVKVGIVLFGVPFLLVAVMALSSAARPGSVARFFRRLRRRR